MIRYSLFGALILTVALVCWDLGRRGAQAYEQMLIQRVENGLDVLGFRWAEIRADGLQLELHGHAPDVFAQELAMESARATAPIARVANYSTATLAPPERRDPVRIELHRDERGITLIGQTSDRRMRSALNQALARHGAGIEVQDLTGIQAAAPPRGWGPEIEVASLAATALPNAFVVVVPGQVTVDAQAADEEERDALSARLLDAGRGVVSVVLNLKTPRFVIAPFTFSANKDVGGGIRLESCAARSADEQVAIRARLDEFEIEQRNDVCPIGLGGPGGDWLAAIATGLGALSDLPAGRLEISYRAVRLTGLSPTSPKRFEAVSETLLSGLPEGFTGDSQLRADDAATLHGISRASYWMHVVAGPDGIRLNGQVPDDSARVAVATYAAALFSADKVDARIEAVDRPAPSGWQTALLRVIETFSRLGAGEVQLAGHRLQLQATVSDPGDAVTLHRALLDALPEFEIETRVSVDLPTRFRAIPLPGRRCAEELSQQIVRQPLDFDTGSAVLTAESRKVLDRLVPILSRCTDDPIEIGGHTDSQGSEDLNQRLSQARAETVRTQLINRGVPLGRLVARGYGEAVPIADNKTDAGRARNRRIEFKHADAADE